MSTESKVCENCDATIGATDEVCPKCSVNFAELEEQVAAVERANKVAAKRAAKNAPPEPPVPPKKKSVFGSLTTKGRK